MQAIFDAPISADLFEQVPGCDLLSGEAGNAINHLLLNLAIFGEDKAPFQSKHLLQVGPVQKVVQLTADGESPFFQSAMPFAGFFDNLKIFFELLVTRNNHSQTSVINLNIPNKN